MQMFTISRTQALLQIATDGVGLDLQVRRHQTPWQKEKVVVVLGATGTGKSKLSIDLATRFPAEIVNSDKMQVYKGLDIVTNKITSEETKGIPHHLLGVIDPNSDFSSSNFCSMASLSLQSITRRGQLPIIVGGSNSFIEALVDDEHENQEFQSRYECCFLWVDVSIPVLHSFVSDRVDKMVERGLVDEVRKMFNRGKGKDYSRGIWRAIGVPELDYYFKVEPFLSSEGRSKLLEEAIDEIKNNTCKLACRQLEKIKRLKNEKKWKVHRLDATQVFRKHGKHADEEWENSVMDPSIRIVERFLYNIRPLVYRDGIQIGQAQNRRNLAAATH
ncbi:RNA processing factor [Lithospermum erythrorhizon]|uniref:adenylate dimethylallyltransferase (ADP/ATP-dependent) n=1 Tax=Lithospermum erythrorhizon TaxID=34254 RepID=A0AAV3QL37_LITER